jgi:hypothetical protein
MCILINAAQSFTLWHCKNAAQALADRLNAEDTEGWTYKVISLGDWFAVECYDEDKVLMGKL